MANFEFEQTCIPSQYGINLKENFSILWSEKRSAEMFRIMFTTIADVLKINQSKDAKRIGMIMKDDKGHFKLGAILTFKEPEEGAEEDTGNFYLEMTFDPEDMTNLDKELDNHSDVFLRCATQEAYEISNARFKDTKFISLLFNMAIDTLVQFLDTNAVDGDIVEVRLNGVFTASVGIEDGKKVMSIVPGECIKQIIKNDSALA